MQNYVTKEGLERLKQELEQLRTSGRKEIAEKLQRAIAQGDLSENAEYQEAKEEQAFLEGRVAELEQMISSAVLIDEHQGGGVVKIGSTVFVERTDKGARREAVFTIVGSEETSPEEGKISYLSPLGAALLGHKAGNKVEIATPGGPAHWRVRAVR